jgi:hypothetical protein
MTPRLRKFALAVHIALSVGWIGAALAYLAVAVSAAASQDAQLLRAAWIAMALIGWRVIVPLAVASVLTGLVMSLGTAWGVIRHYWVLASLALTIGSAAVLVQHLRTVTVRAAMAAQPDGAALGELRGALAGEWLHAGLGVVVLIAIEALNVYKPHGLTPYGRRVAAIAAPHRTVAAVTGRRVPPAPGLRWGPVVGIHAIGLAVLVAILHLTGVALQVHHQP